MPALLGTMRDPEVLRFTRTPDPMPDNWLQKWLAKFDGEYRVGFAILDGDEYIGYAVTGPIDREGLEVELGYAVAPWGRGRGVATETLRQLDPVGLRRGHEAGDGADLRRQPRVVAGGREGRLHLRGGAALGPPRRRPARRPGELVDPARRAPGPVIGWRP